MEISIHPLGPLGTNCILVTDQAAKACVVIDPACKGQQVAELVAASGCKLTYILLTHGHWDHIGGVDDLHRATGAPVYIHKGDLVLPLAMTKKPLFHTDTYEDGDVLPFGDYPITVMSTPGHTPGSVCLKMGGHLFAGDTLFHCSCGRVDFPLGDPQAMMDSMSRLASMEEDLPFTPGHGEGSTLFAQRSCNPYFRKRK